MSCRVSVMIIRIYSAQLLKNLICSSSEADRALCSKWDMTFRRRIRLWIISSDGSSFGCFFMAICRRYSETDSLHFLALRSIFSFSSGVTRIFIPKFLFRLAIFVPFRDEDRKRIVTVILVITDTGSQGQSPSRYCHFWQCRGCVLAAVYRLAIQSLCSLYSQTSSGCLFAATPMAIHGCCLPPVYMAIHSAQSSVTAVTAVTISTHRGRSRHKRHCRHCPEYHPQHCFLFCQAGLSASCDRHKASCL